MLTAKERCGEWNVSIERRIRRKQQMPGENCSDEGLTAEKEIVHVMKSVLDRFQQELCTRFAQLDTLNAKFGFLLDIDDLMKKENQTALQQNCIHLGSFYESDVDGNQLHDEICDCKMLLTTRQNSTPKSPLELLSFIISYGEDVFPNLIVALQILMTIAVSIASCERSFSKLKLILSYTSAHQWDKIV